MATFRKREDTGRWEARIRRKGYPTQSASFRTKYEAERWARHTESQMDRRLFKDASLAEGMTVEELVTRYVDEVLKETASYSREKSRIKNIIRLLGTYTLINVTVAEVVTFRDTRLKHAIPEDADSYTAADIEAQNRKDRRVGPQSVVHEMGLLTRAIDHAMSEWKLYLPHGNPLRSVKRPKKPHSRTRRVDDDELEILIAHSDSPVFGDLCRFAVETAMRRGELGRMRWTDVDLRDRTLHIPKTKNGVPRTIPLSRRATAILQQLPRRLDGSVWGLKADSITQAFIRARERAGIEDLHFHDLRHEATSRLHALGLNVIDLAAITGHQELQSLKRYTHPKGRALVGKLDRAEDRAAG